MLIHSDHSLINSFNVSTVAAVKTEAIAKKCMIEECTEEFTNISKFKSHLDDHRIEHIFSIGFDRGYIADSRTSKADIIRRIIQDIG